MPHPDEGLIHEWLDGELDPAEAARVEALVARDADWAAAAAEARGLIAASARIVGALDRVPASVVPKPAPARPAPRRWVWRAAAVLALMAGSAVVLERKSPELPAPNTATAVSQEPPAPATRMPPAATGSALAAAPGPKVTQHAVRAPVEAGAKRDVGKKELADSKSEGAAAGKDVAASTGEVSAKVAPAVQGANIAQAERRAANAPVAATEQAGARAAAPAAQSFATDRLTRLQPSCFAQREPADSAARIIRLSAAALQDSIRLETLVLRGDTLAAVNGRLKAVRVRCPEP